MNQLIQFGNTMTLFLVALFFVLAVTFFVAGMRYKALYFFGAGLFNIGVWGIQ